MTKTKNAHIVANRLTDKGQLVTMAKKHRADKGFRKFSSLIKICHDEQVCGSKCPTIFYLRNVSANAAEANIKLNFKLT